MKNFNPNQLTLDLFFEEKVKYETKTTNPFLLSERVKRILYKRGYSFLFNYPMYKEFKALSAHIPSLEKAEYIADLFCENTHDLSDFNEYQF